MGFESTGTASRLTIDGIRVFGVFGPMAYVTRNDLVGFTTGIRVGAPSVQGVTMWRVTENIAVGAAKTVDLTYRNGLITKATSTGNVP